MASSLQTYLIKRVLEAQDEIAPELFDYVGGKDESEIDASIENAKRATAGLVARAQQQQFRPDDADIFRFQADVQTGFGDMPDVRSMSMDQWGVYRQHLGLGR